MISLPPSVKIFVSAVPVDARKSFDGLAAMVESEFGLEPLSGHLFVFVSRRGNVAQILFWDRNGFCIFRKRLESGTFKLTSVQQKDGASHVQINSADLTLMLEGIDLSGSRRRKRYQHSPSINQVSEKKISTENSD
jgi:transposase